MGDERGGDNDEEGKGKEEIKGERNYLKCNPCVSHICYIYVCDKGAKWVHVCIYLNMSLSVYQLITYGKTVLCEGKSTVVHISEYMCVCVSVCVCVCVCVCVHVRE